MKYQAKALADVDKAIADAIKSYGNTKRLIQVACVAILTHIKAHGDYRKANTLVEGLVGLNQAALVEYFAHFGGLVVSEGAKGFSGWSGADKVDVEGGKKKMWYTFKVQNPWKGFDLKAAVLHVIDQAGKAEQRVDKDESLNAIVDINPDLLDNLKRLVA